MWYQLHQSRYLQYDSPFVISTLFRSNILVVEAALNLDTAYPYGRRSYKYAGRLTPLFNKIELGEHKGRSRRLFLGKSQIEFENPLNYEFFLELDIHLWTPQLDLTIWQSDEEPEKITATDLLFIENGIARVEQKLDAMTTGVDTTSSQ